MVNDLGGTMDGDGADALVADEVVDEIRRARRPRSRLLRLGRHARGRRGDRRDRDRRVRPARRRGEQRRHLPDHAVRGPDAPTTGAACSRVHLDGAFHLSQPAYRVMKAQGYGRFVFIASSAGTVRPAELGALRRGQGRHARSRQRHRHRGRRARDPRQLRAAVRLLPDGLRDRRRPRRARARARVPPRHRTRARRPDRRRTSPAAPASSPTTASRPAPDASPASSSGSATAGSPNPAAHPTADDIAEHLDRDRRGRARTSIPTSIFDEVVRGLRPARHRLTVSVRSARGRAASGSVSRVRMPAVKSSSDAGLDRGSRGCGGATRAARRAARGGRGASRGSGGCRRRRRGGG